MSSLDPRETREYLSGLKLANDFEIEELRRAPVELKVRQLWALMTSADLFEDEVLRNALSDLTAWLEDARVPAILGHDREFEQLESLLARRNLPSKH